MPAAYRIVKGLNENKRWPDIRRIPCVVRLALYLPPLLFTIFLLKRPVNEIIDEPVGLMTDMSGLYFLMIVLYGLIAALALNRRYFTTPSVQHRAQIFFIVFGTIIGVLSLAILRLVFYGFDIITWRHLFTDLSLITLPLLFIPLSCGYAIIKHRMLDVQLIIRKGLLYVSLTLLLAASSFGLILLASTLFQGLLASTSPFVVAPTTLLIAAAFIPLRNRLQLAIDRRFFREKIDQAATLRRLAEDLPSVRDLSAVTRHLVDTVDGALHLERALLLTPQDGVFTARYATAAMKDDNTFSLPADHPLAARLAGQDTALYLADEHALRALPEQSRAEVTGQGIDLLVALKAQERLVGLLALGPRRSELPFSAEDRSLLAGLAGPAALALENARLYGEAVDRERLARELQVARAMQLSLLPDAPPPVEGYALAGLCQPAYEVGGDHYGFHWLDEARTRLAIVVADVSGKEMQAAMTVMRFAELLYYETQRGQDAASLLSGLNRAMLGRFGRRVFVTACAVVVDVSTGAATISNAGHPPAYRVRSDGVVEEIDVTGYPLGLRREAVYRSTTVRLALGDTLALYSDGLYEARGRAAEQFGFSRLGQALGALSGVEASALCERLMADVEAYTGGTTPEDDRTVVVVRRT